MLDAGLSPGGPRHSGCSPNDGGVPSGSAWSLSPEERLQAIVADSNLTALEVMQTSHRLLAEVFGQPAVTPVDCKDSLPRIAELLASFFEQAKISVSDPQHLDQLRILHNKSFSILGRHIRAVHERVRAPDAVELMRQFAAAGVSNLQLFECLSSILMGSVNELSPHEKVSVLSAHTQIRLRNGQIVAAIASSITTEVSTLPADDVSAIARSFDENKIFSPELLKAFSDRVQTNPADFQVSHLASIAHLFVSANHRDPPFFESIVPIITAANQRGELTPKERRSFVSGIASLALPPERCESPVERAFDELLSAVEAPDMLKLVSRLYRCKPQIIPARAFEAMESRIISLRDGFGGRDLADLLDVLRATGRLRDGLLSVLADRAVECAADLACRNADQSYSLSPGSLSTILSLVAKREAQLREIDLQEKSFSPLHYPQIFIDSAPAIRERIKECSGRDVATVAWAFASARVRDVALFSEIAAHAIELAKVDRLNPRDVSSLLHSFAVVNIPHRGLACELAKVCDRKRILFYPQEIANTAWGLAFSAPDQVYRIATPDLLDTLQHPLDWLQVYQALIISGQIEYNPEKLPARYHEIVALQPASGETHFQLMVRHHVSRLLHRYGLDIRPSQVIAGVETDIEISEPVGRAIQNGMLRKVRKVAVECDGDSFHRLYGPDAEVLLGKDRQQDNLFRKCGWEPVHISSSRFHRNSDQAISDLVSEIMRALGIEDDESELPTQVP